MSSLNGNPKPVPWASQPYPPTSWASQLGIESIRLAVTPNLSRGAVLAT